MLKQRFLKNSAKVLYVSTGVLFVSNLILLLNLLLPEFESKIGFLSKLPELSVYIFTFFSYLALNDEKAAHRKIKDVKSQKKVRVLKIFLLVVFLAIFFKSLIQNYLMNLNDSVANMLLNLFMVVSSFSFFMLVLSVWYFYRDKDEGNIKFASLASIIVSLAYAVYKFLMYQSNIGADSSEYINSEIMRYGFCLVQYMVNIIMLVLVNKHYSKKEIDSETLEKKDSEIMFPEIIETLETEVGCGIDYVDDYKNGLI